MSREFFKVNLIPGSIPQDPIKAIWMVWEQSRCDDSIEVMERRYERLLKGDNKPESDFPVDNKHPRDRFRLMLAMDIPIVEFMHMTFLLDNIPVSFREHLVRHRIGTKIGPQAFVDEDPGVADASIWSQTSRVRDMQDFFDNGYFYTPELNSTDLRPITQGLGAPDVPAGLTDQEVYHKVLQTIQWGYRELRGRGYKPEICREVNPSSMTQRLAWHVNLKSLKHICSHRTCWIAMSPYWHPIIEGVITELSKIDKAFRILATPPCIDKQGKEYEACAFAHENMQRLKGADPGVPCPLWLNHTDGVPLPDDWRRGHGLDTPIFDRMCDKFKAFWMRDLDTGASLV
jgi:hypothetical protein